MHCRQLYSRLLAKLLKKVIRCRSWLIHSQLSFASVWRRIHSVCFLSIFPFPICCTFPWNCLQCLQLYVLSRADGNYNTQGKLGAAVLGNVETQVYQLLLYKGKQQHVSSVRISPSFQFVVRTETECYITSSECSGLFPQLGYLTNVPRILHFTRSQWITIVLCLCRVYLANKLGYTYQMFAWLLLLCSHDIPSLLDMSGEADCRHTSHMSACQVELSHGTATDLDEITKET